MSQSDTRYYSVRKGWHGMNFFYALAFLIAVLVLLLAVFTRIGVWWIEHNNPADGQFTDIDGARVHHHHLVTAPEKPTIVFIHGASSNLHDQMSVYAKQLANAYNLLFYDRPGHGYSDATQANAATPRQQAAALSGLLEALGIKEAIIVGHSFGGAVAASFAVFHPEKTKGLVLLSPVSHPWPGGVNWYYDFASRPALGRLFVHTLALPAALTRFQSGAACVFAPNPVTVDYDTRTRAQLLMRPGQFRSNAMQISTLYDYVSAIYPRYSEIKTPTIILTGNRDTIVLADIHAIGLARQIEGAELYWIKNLGHKPDHIADKFVNKAIAKLAGDPTIDLKQEAMSLEEQLSDHNYGPIENCLKNDIIANALAKDDKARLDMVHTAGE